MYSMIRSRLSLIAEKFHGSWVSRVESSAWLAYTKFVQQILTST